MKKEYLITLLIFTIILSIIIFFIFIKDSASTMFCKQQVSLKFNELKKSAGKGGWPFYSIENDYWKKPLKIDYQNCLTSEGL